MRSTDIRAVPSTGSAAIDFDVGQRNVSAIVVHNASYRAVMLTLSDGTSRTLGPERSDAVHLLGNNGAFDGHITLTPGSIITAQTNAGSVWLDVYLAGEKVQGTYPASCPVAMTAGNQQPRSQIVPMPAPVTTPVTISIASGGADVTTTIGSIPFPVTEQFPAIGFWLFGFTIDASNTSAAAGELWVITITLNLSLLLGGVIQGTPTTIYKVNLVGVGPSLSNPVRFLPAFPLVKYIFANGADSLALQSVTHISILAAARAVVQTNNYYYDIDLSNTNLPPGPGGGVSSLTAGFPTQYIGSVW